MDLNLEQAFEEPVDLSHRLEVPSERLDRAELLSLSPIAFTGRLMRVDPGFVLTGHLGFTGTVACARCLAPVSFERSEKVSWVFAPAHQRPSTERAEETELSPDDLDVIYYDELTLPFDPLIEEQVQLELPMKALCREECRGLCPSCGADRNVTPCMCAEPADERWQALRSLLRS